MTFKVIFNLRYDNFVAGFLDTRYEGLTIFPLTQPAPSSAGPPGRVSVHAALGQQHSQAQLPMTQLEGTLPETEGMW